MSVFENDVDVTARKDGDRMEWIATHVFTGCRVVWGEVDGKPRHDQARETAITALKLMVYQYGY